MIYLRFKWWICRVFPNVWLDFLVFFAGGLKNGNSEHEENPIILAKIAYRFIDKQLSLSYECS